MKPETVTEETGIRTATAQPRSAPPTGSVRLGFMAWCWCDHYYELEGIIWCSRLPRVGDTFKSCDGHEYTVTRVNSDSMEMWGKAAPNEKGQP